MIKRIVLAASLVLAAIAPAAAQFADQATYAGAGAGTANAQTLTLANASSYADLVGVIVKYTPGATNTGAATLTVNGFGSSPSFRKPNGAGVTALTGGELVSGQPTMIMYDGTFFNVMAPTALPIGAGNLTTSAFGFNASPNLQLNGSVSANQLTIAVKTSAGTDATSANPIPIAFRDTTIANGDPVWVSITGSLSFTIGSGSTMGCVNNVMCRLWIVAINNSGSVALCAFKAVSGTNVAAIDESQLQTSASGTSGGSSAQTYYCSTSAVTSKAIRILGYVDIQEATAGTWASGPTYVQLFGPGIKRPGDLIQTRNVLYTSTTSTTNNYAFGNTAPAAGNGVSVAAITMTAQSAANLVRVRGMVNIASNGAGNLWAYLLIGSTAVSLNGIGSNGSVEMHALPVEYVGQMPSGSTTWTMYGSGTLSTTYINTNAGGNTFGGSPNSILTVDEIQG